MNYPSWTPIGLVLIVSSLCIVMAIEPCSARPLTLQRNTQSGCPAPKVGDRQVITGEITKSDCKSPSEGVFFTCDLYSFEALADQRVDILVTENEFNTCLVLYSPTGGQITKDDNGAYSRRGWISTTIPKTGTYTFEIRPSSLSKKVGKYAIRFLLGGNPVPVADGQTVVGSLSIDDYMSPAPKDLKFNIFSSFADVYSFHGKAKQRLDCLLTEAAFKGQFVLYSPNKVAILTEKGTTRQPWMSTELPETGSYILEIRSHRGLDTGNYSFRFNLGCPGETTSIGKTITNDLSLKDCMSLNRKYCHGDRFVFEGKAGQEINLSVVEANFDTYLVLYSPLGNPIAENDNDGFDTNKAKISTTLTTTGTYMFEVSSSRQFTTGSYVVRLATPTRPAARSKKSR